MLWRQCDTRQVIEAGESLVKLLMLGPARKVTPADGKLLTVDSGPDNCSPTLLCMIKVKIANCTKGMAVQIAVDSSLDNSSPTLLCVTLVKIANCRKTVDNRNPPRHKPFLQQTK